jgi:dolichyl-phosphate-mannose-protein mannosyltransferase
MGGIERSPERVLVLAGAAIWLAVLAKQRPIAISGDPYGIFFPVVQGIVRGHGLSSFAPLWRGPLKMPGWPILISVFGVFEDDLIAAAQMAGALCAMVTLAVMAWALKRTGASAIEIIVAAALAATSPVFARAAMEPLPDMAACAALALTAYFLIRGLETPPSAARSDRPASKLLFFAGASAGAAVLFRVNALALYPAGLVAIAVHERATRWRRVLAFSAGFIAAGLVGATPTIALFATRGIVVPHLFIRYIDNNIGEASGFDSFVKICEHGLKETVFRVRWAMQWPIAAIGVAGMTVAIVRKRQLESIVAAAILFFMLGVLVPIHFEARYYVYAIPILAAAFVATYAAAVRRFHVPSAIAIGLVATIGSASALHQGRRSLRLARREVKADAPFRALCDRLIEAERKKGRPVMIGISPVFYTFERLRMCPTPRARPEPVVVVPAGPDDAGIDFWLARETASPSAWAPVASAGDRTLFERTAENQGYWRWIGSARTSSRSQNLLEEAWRLRAPVRPSESCERRVVDPPPGDYRAAIAIAAEPPLTGRLTLRSGAHQRTVWGTGESSLPVDGDIEVVAGQKLELTFCIGDPLLSAGEVEIRSLALDRL